MATTLREVLVACRPNFNMKRCTSDSLTMIHEPLNKKWYPWDFTDGIIEHYLGPALDDVVEFPAGHVPDEWNVNPLGELGIGNFYDKFFVCTINLAIKHICNKIGIDKPVTMRRTHGSALIENGSSIKSDWWSGTEDDIKWISLPGDDKATSEAVLAKCFDEESVKPGQDISALRDKWTYARYWLGQGVSYAKWLDVRYFFLVTSHEVVVGQVAAAESGTPTSGMDRKRVRDEVQGLRNGKGKGKAPDISKPGAKAPPKIATPEDRKSSLRSHRGQNAASTSDVGGLTVSVSSLSVVTPGTSKYRNSMSSPASADRGSVYEPTPKGLVDTPRVEIARVPYDPSSKDEAQHPALALVFLHVLAAVSREQEVLMLPLTQDVSLLSAIRDRLRQ